MNEKTLVKECIAGKTTAQRELFDRFSPLMLGVAIRYMKDKALAEDVLQDAFIKIFKNLKHYKHKGSLEGWIRRIVVNTALDQIRKYKKEQRNIEIDGQNINIAFRSNATDKLQEEDLLQIINQLPDGFRIIFNLFAIEGYSHKEIAQQLDISVSTSKSQYSRARAALRETLKDYVKGD